MPFYYVLIFFFTHLLFIISSDGTMLSKTNAFAYKFWIASYIHSHQSRISSSDHCFSPNPYTHICEETQTILNQVTSYCIMPLEVWRKRLYLVLIVNLQLAEKKNLSWNESWRNLTDFKLYFKIKIMWKNKCNIQKFRDVHNIWYITYIKYNLFYKQQEN